MLRAKIQDHIKQAMKDKNQVRLDALRYLWSELKNIEIDAKHELADSEIIELISREVKKRKDAIEQFKSANRHQLVDEEQAKLAVVMEFMPEQLTSEQIEDLVDKIRETGVSDFPSVMKQLMPQIKGKADGKLVSEIVKQKTSV